jgi:hypothetical protein
MLFIAAMDELARAPRAIHLNRHPGGRPPDLPGRLLGRGPFSSAARAMQD